MDLSPITDELIKLAAAALGAAGSWALWRVAQWFRIRRDNAAVAAWDDAITKSVQAGAVALMDLIAEKGWNHPEIKSAIIRWAAPYAIDKFKGALKGVGLDASHTDATTATVKAALDRAFPTAITPVVFSPVTPPIPPSPPGTTAEDLNSAELARLAREGGRP